MHLVALIGQPLIRWNDPKTTKEGNPKNQNLDAVGGQARRAIILIELINHVHWRGRGSCSLVAG
jgi:hypothetical protein